MRLFLALLLTLPGVSAVPAGKAPEYVPKAAGDRVVAFAAEAKADAEVVPAAPVNVADAKADAIRDIDGIRRTNEETAAALRDIRETLYGTPKGAAPKDDDPTPPTVALDGPTEIPSGGFHLAVTAPANAKLRWRNSYPEGAAEPLKLRDDDGKQILVFLQTVPGVYEFYLSAQVPAEGLDPFAEATHRVKVGQGPQPPPPGPPGPPTPPNLTGLAKAVYEAAKGLPKATLTQAAGAYGSQVSAINAGAYAAVSMDAAKDSIAKAITEANPPRNAAPALFDVIDGELQKLEEAGKFATLPAVSAALAEVSTGLEAAAK